MALHTALQPGYLSASAEHAAAELRFLRLLEQQQWSLATSVVEAWFADRNRPALQSDLVHWVPVLAQRWPLRLGAAMWLALDTDLHLVPNGKASRARVHCKARVHRSFSQRFGADAFDQALRRLWHLKQPGCSAAVVFAASGEHVWGSSMLF